MRRLAGLVLAVLAGTVALTEVAVQPTSRDRLVLSGVYLATALATLAGYVVLTRVQPRLRSLRGAVLAAGLGSVLVAGLAVVLAAQTMFLSPHDRNLVLVALALGVALGGALSLALSTSLGRDMERLARAAERVAAGDLEARTGVERRDELGSAARAFDRMVERLRANEEERRIFLASVGHDLRTPLASLRAAVEALEDGVAPDPEAYLHGMALDVVHLSELVDDLFLLARLEAGRLELDREPVDLAELADEAVEALAPLAARAGVALRVEGGERVGAVVDPAGMGRVVRNLLDNAIRHAPTGSEVLVQVGSEGLRRWIRVVDGGPGFPDELRRPGIPAREGWRGAGDDAGSGLGLAIARGIVEAHGGTMAIEDGPGGRVVVEVAG